MSHTHKLKAAREEFVALLGRNAPEAMWQDFFSRQPCVFSQSLPVKLQPDDIRARGRPGKSEPDFIFFPKGRPLAPYGVIEIKRPNAPIVTRARESVLRLSSDAATAVAQGQVYAEELHREIFKPGYEMIAVGNHPIVFMIMGLSRDLAKKVTTDLLREQYEKLLPRGFTLIPYDSLLRMFEDAIPPTIMFLVPGFPLAGSEQPIVDYEERGRVTGIPPTATHLRGVVKIATAISNATFVWPIGGCIYCGDLQGHVPLVDERVTIVGSYKPFFSSERDGYSFRLMRCNRMTSATGLPLEFVERYRSREVSEWFSQLKAGKCGRCGSTHIDYSDKSHDLEGPMYRDESWTCNACGFYEVVHGWGPLSHGA